MRICHVGTLPLECMGTQTRVLFSRAEGEHAYALLGHEIPDADVYILECFKRQHEEFRVFEPPVAARVISWMHSSAPCEPAECSDVVVCSTHWSAEYVRRTFGADSVVIPYGLDWSGRFGQDPTEPTFGCILRRDEGKFHPEWSEIMRAILSAVPESRLKVATGDPSGLLTHERAEYFTSIRTSENRDKINFLSRLLVAVFAHGDFEEVFPMAVLECMSVGLPIAYLYQPSMHEMVGDSQVCCHSPEVLANSVVRLLEDVETSRRLGALAQARARQFTIIRQVSAWNAVLEDLCR